MAVRVYDYRRALLTLCAAFYIPIGLAHVFMTSSPVLDRGFGWLPTSADANELGWAWVAGGLLIGVAAWAPWRCSDKVAFGTAILLPAAWACIFAISWAAFDNPLGLRSSLAWALITGLLVLVAAWPNPPLPREDA